MLCRVERGVESQVSEAAFDSRRQRERNQHRPLPVPRSGHRSSRRARVAKTEQSTAAMS